VPLQRSQSPGVPSTDEEFANDDRAQRQTGQRRSVELAKR
jgi:hypothetical protein